MVGRFKFFHGMDITLSYRKFLSIALLISSVLAWFLVVNTFYPGIMRNNLGVDLFWANVNLTLFYGSGAFFALIGSTVSGRIDRRILIGSSIIVGVFASAFISFFQGNSLSLILSLLFGFSLGFGFPSAFAFLSDSTEPEGRGRVAGLVMLATFILTFIGITSILFFAHALLIIILFFTISRSLGLISLAIDKCERAPKKEASWKNVIQQRSFMLFLIPWMLFCLATGIWDWSSSTLAPQFETIRGVGIVVSLIFMAVSGVMAGALADRIGRKTPTIIALVLIGVSFALVGLVQIPETIILYYTIYGIAWGFLFTLNLTIQGDFAPMHVKEKFHALGISLPLIIFMGSNSTLNFILGASGVSISLLSPILSALIFLSIIPIWRANEPLAASKISERKLKDHIKKVEKIIEDQKK